MMDLKLHSRAYIIVLLTGTSLRKSTESHNIEFETMLNLKKKKKLLVYDLQREITNRYAHLWQEYIKMKRNQKKKKDKSTPTIRTQK